MKFRTVPIEESPGAILAHSLKSEAGRLKKGKRLDHHDVEALRRMGMTEVTVARLDADDHDEDTAADLIAEALIAGVPGLRRTPAVTGRSNLHADITGVLAIRAQSVIQFNEIGGGITLATLPDLARVHPGAMVATLKIVTYGVPAQSVDRARTLAGDVFALWPVMIQTAGLIITRHPSTPDASITKSRRVIHDRLSGLGLALKDNCVVPHTVTGIRKALAHISGEIILILTASATSDLHDTAPLAVLRAGGCIDHFGIPVDPGNLLFHGSLADRPVIGLPGCARSPALNGADWFLERLVCGVPITCRDIAAMGVGGLLKEIPSRPFPRDQLCGS